MYAKLENPFKNIGKSVEEKIYSKMTIESNHIECGYACKKKTDGNLLSRYKYYQVILDDQVYTIYCIGLGKEGVKYPVYTNNRQIALIEEKNISFNNNEEYYISTIEDNINSAIILFIGYLKTSERMSEEHNENNNSNKGIDLGDIGVNIKYNKTLNEDLLSKYDPNFKKNNGLE